MAKILTETGDQLNAQTGSDLITETDLSARRTNFAAFGGDDWPLVIAFAESGFEDY